MEAIAHEFYFVTPFSDIDQGRFRPTGQNDIMPFDPDLENFIQSSLLLQPPLV